MIVKHSSVVQANVETDLARWARTRYDLWDVERQAAMRAEIVRRDRLAHSQAVERRKATNGFTKGDH